MNNLNLSETVYEWWDTYKDILLFTEVFQAIENAVSFLEESDEVFNGKTYGDKIRFVFGRDHGKQEVLKELRNLEWLEVKKLITLILVIENIKDILSTWVNSVEYISEFGTLSLIETYKEKSELFEWEEEVEKEVMSVVERMERLLENWFPLISTEWDIVMFFDVEQPCDDTAWVIELDSETPIKMDKYGRIIVENQGKDDWESAKERAAKKWINLV